MGQKKSFTNLFNLVAPWLIALIVWTVIVRGMFPLLLRPISLHAFSGFILTAPILFLLLLLAFSLPEKFRSYAAIPLIAAAFASAISGMHATTSTNTIYIAGLLPYSDAASYYWDALNLQAGRLFSDFASRRPMFAVILSFLLTVLQNNLMAVQITMTLMTTVAIILAAQAIRRQFGAVTASLFVVLMLFFYRLFLGSTMTENLGILLGCLALPLLFYGSSRRSAAISLVGIGCLTLGLIARAGPFIAVIGLSVWFAFTFYNRNWLQRALGLLLALSFIAGAFGVNKLVGMQTNSPGGVAFANFSYSFYGVTVGGERWNKVFDDHPELHGMSVEDQTARIYSLAFENIKTHPELLLKGIASQYGYLVSPTWYNLFGYVESENKTVRLVAQYSLMVLSLLGVVAMFRRRKLPFASMLLFLWLGLLLSVPFVPPVDTNRMRAYATAIPYLALMPGIGLAWLAGLIPKIKVITFSKQYEEPKPVFAAIFLGLVMLVLLAGPGYVKMRSTELTPGYTTCQEGFTPFVMRVPEGSYLHIRAERDFFLDRTPEIHAGRFRRLMHNMPFMDAVAAFESLESPLILTTGVDILTGRVAWLTIPTDVFVPSPKTAVYCGNWQSRGEGMGNLFFKVDYFLGN